MICKAASSNSVFSTWHLAFSDYASLNVRLNVYDVQCEEIRK